MLDEYNDFLHILKDDKHNYSASRDSRPQGSNGLLKTVCDVGMKFGNFRIHSINIGNGKTLRTPPRKRWMHSGRDRQNKDSLMNAHDVFQKAFDVDL